tara:strand:+ start:610 stop:1557 length:948 start_codon:yes stop_codon:yes gene_type:complete
MNRKAIIFGIKGTKLTNEESKLIQLEKPWGIILFDRNINNISQLKNLTSNIRSKVKDKYYPILIDQEGGTVSRLNKILNFSLFPQEYFGNLYKLNKANFKKNYKIYVDHVSDLLNNIGININTVPVLDIARSKTHKIIGDRAFSKNCNLVRKIGIHCNNLFLKNRIGTVMKHIPGHGLAQVDSHFKTPTVNNSKKELKSKDFKPFKFCKSPFAMTSHVIYKKYDPIFTATHSKIIISEIIRKYIGFKGLLISDDISMKSLRFNLEKNATTAIDAGCNIVMHCNGNIKEMRRLVKIIPKIDSFTIKKTSQFYKFLR